MFCSCRVCENARRQRGRDVRNRPMALLDDELCIDLPCDARSSFLMQQAEARKIRYLLVTHNHYDHFLAANLLSRPEGAQPLKLFISRESGQEILQMTHRARSAPEKPGMRPICVPEIHFAEPFVTFSCGKFLVTPLPARHDRSVGTLNFLITAEEKTVLWLHDTGPLLDKTVDYFQTKPCHFDFVSMDCALPCGVPVSNEHMDILHCKKTVDLLRKLSCVNDKTAVYLSHIGHLVGCTHEELSEQARQLGFHVAYDGAVITIE